MGSSNPFAACANIITATGSSPSEATNAPKAKIVMATVLKRVLLISLDQPSMPHTAYAPANGAVIALVNPAANKPIAKK